MQIYRFISRGKYTIKKVFYFLLYMTLNVHMNYIVKHYFFIPLDTFYYFFIIHDLHVGRYLYFPFAFGNTC